VYENPCSGPGAVGTANYWSSLIWINDYCTDQDPDLDLDLDPDPSISKQKISREI
jgi:hypothetical protein